MSAWRLLDEDRRLRRPAGSPEAVGELPDDLVSGLALDGVDLAGSRRQRLTLLDSVLRRCELTAAVWQQVTVRQTELVDCRALGLRLSVDLAQDLWVSGCRFDQAVLHLERVRGLVVFSGCSFTEAELSGDLSRVVAVDCDFAGCEFAASAAAGFDLRGSRLAGSRGLLTLRGARITLEQTLTIADRLATEAGLTLDP
ncbi:MAG TPA: hypothetical protein VF109_03365 [Mycobacteriales bacterium]